MRLGPYETIAPIASGGAGAVFRARGPDGREVALKILARTDESARIRFEREGRLLRDLGALEGFVPLLDVGKGSDGVWIAMPLVRGGTLRDKLRGGPLDVASTVALALSLSRALGLAHARGIVHRDLKPENVLFDGEGRPLIADLGIAKHFDRGAEGGSQSVSLSRDGAFLGTAGYMAPEQVSDAQSAGPRADVFALGAILYECLAGAPAFAGQGVMDVLARLASGSVEPLARRDVPRWLESAILKALARDPESRFEDGAAFARVIEAKGERRKLPVRPLLGAVALALLVALGAVAWRVAAGAGSGARALAAPELVERAAARLAEGDAAGAKEDGESAVALDAKLAAAWRERGRARRALDDHAGAFADMSRAIELDPRDGRARAERARLRLEQRGETKPALEDAQVAVERAPDLGLARVVLSAALLAQGDTRGAEREAERGVELSPDDGDAWVQLGRAKGRKNDLDAAYKAFTRATAVAPRSLAAWSGRTNLALARHDWFGAVAQTTSAIALFPGTSHFLSERARARYRLEDHEGAIADCTKALELDPRSGDALLCRGASRERRDDFEGAVADFEKYLELYPKGHFAKDTRERIQRIRPGR